MMRGLLELFTIFDWITPSIGFIQDFKNDPTLLQTNSWTFFFDYGDLLNAGYNAVDVERLLHQHGIKTWGSQITGGEYFFSVPIGQTELATNILNQRGIVSKY